MRRLSGYIKKLIIVVLVLILTPVMVSGCNSTEQAEQSAYNHVLDELRADGHPTGMFGATWYMTQQDLGNILTSLHQLDANTLVQSRTLYDRPIQASYHFKSEDFNNRLWLIVVSFEDEFYSSDQFATAFYTAQDYLSRDYGAIPEPVMHELVPSSNGVWEDQDFLDSTKHMGRVTLIHQITIRDNALGEQILMYLGKEES